MPSESPNPETKRAAPAQGRPARFVHGTDLAVALVILAFCALAYYATTLWEEPSALFQDNIAPEFFPRLMIWTIALLTLLLPFEHRAIAKRGHDIDEERSTRIRPIAYLTAILLFAIVLASPWLGTLLSMVVACLTIPLLWGERRLRIVIPFAILFPLAVTLLFSKVLKVYFEPGLLGETLGSLFQ